MAAAEQHHRRVLGDGPSPSGTSGSIPIPLAELLIDHHAGGQAAEEAAALPTEWARIPQLQFDSELSDGTSHKPGSRFASGHDLARRSAGTALELAAREPQLKRHPTVGLVDTGQRLSLATRADPGPGPLQPMVVAARTIGQLSSQSTGIRPTRTAASRAPARPAAAGSPERCFKGALSSLKARPPPERATLLQRPRFFARDDLTL